MWELMQTAHVVGRRFTELMAGVGLTPTQLAVLMHLHDREGATQAELARVVLVSPQSIGGLLSPLLDRGLVVRDGPGGRGRRAGLRLTDAGRQALHRAWEPVRDFNTPAALGLTAAQAAILVEVLRRVRTTITDEPDGPAATKTGTPGGPQDR